jgi:tetratricopeptide (TPR) repeat protein
MRKSLFQAFLIILLTLSTQGLVPASEVKSASETYSRANSLCASARFHDALILYQNVLAAPPEGVSSGEVHSRIGDCEFRLGNFKNALDAYRAALKNLRETQKPETQYWIGFCCFLLGRDAEAVTEFLKIPQNYPASAMWVGTAYYWAGRASERRGETDRAAEYYRKAGGKGKTTQGKFALKKAVAVNNK